MPFYVDNLLIRPDFEIVPFSSSLLYCPIIFDEEAFIYKIAPDYLHEVGQYVKNWQNKVLMIEFLVEEKPVYCSYLKLTHKKNNIVGQVGSVRDKIFQFMILDFMKYITKTQKSEVYLQGTIAELKIKFSIQNVPD